MSEQQPEEQLALFDFEPSGGHGEADVLTLWDLYDPEHEIDDEGLDWGDDDEEYYGPVVVDLDDC